MSLLHADWFPLCLYSPVWMPSSFFNLFLKVCFSPAKQFNIETRKRLLLAHAGFFYRGEIWWYYLFIIRTLTFSKSDRRLPRNEIEFSDSNSEFSYCRKRQGRLGFVLSSLLAIAPLVLICSFAFPRLLHLPVWKVQEMFERAHCFVTIRQRDIGSSHEVVGRQNKFTF